MEIRVLRYFLVTAREQNITKAAELLHITQPTLSRQLAALEEMKLSRHTGDAPLPEHRAQALLYAAMAALEEELGTSLFIRGNKKITLTEKGILL
mgnify:CR=1 FL=1